MQASALDVPRKPRTKLTVSHLLKNTKISLFAPPAPAEAAAAVAPVAEPARKFRDLLRPEAPARTRAPPAKPTRKKAERPTTGGAARAAASS